MKNAKVWKLQTMFMFDVIIDLCFGVNEISFIASFSVSPANAVTLTSSGWENWNPILENFTNVVETILEIQYRK